MTWDPYNPTLNMDEVARRARQAMRGQVRVECCGSGGGCATIYVGWGYILRGKASDPSLDGRRSYDTDCYPVLGGCGTVGSPNWAYAEEFSVGYDQDQPESDRWGPTVLSPHPLWKREVRAAREILSLYARHPKAICRRDGDEFYRWGSVVPLSFDELEAMGYDPTAWSMR